MTKENVFDSHKFKLWKRHLERNGLEIHQVEHIYTRHNHKGEVLFALLLLDATTPEGHKIPPICFLKGEVVCVLVCLIDQDTQQKYQLLVKQRRICDGSLTYEHPAGMLDSESDAAKVAAREVWEETGIEVSEHQLVRLLDFPAHPSSGTSDEAMYYFYCEIPLSYPQIMAYNDRNMGEASEHERIVTEVLPFVEGHRRINNVNGILLDFLYLKDVGDWETMRLL
ncbi:MAG: NUDIX domain-containing protein [Spirosomaceae bacterium]|nr:NUDIX domain-containing protein [Spirosomataceae bacterium]